MRKYLDSYPHLVKEFDFSNRGESGYGSSGIK